MDKQKSHEELVDDFSSLNRYGKKKDQFGMFMQISIITVLLSWRPAQMDHYKIAAPILLSLSLYFFLKDFLAFLKIDRTKGVIISRGIKLEEKNTNSGTFFHESLEDFNFLMILSLRSIVNLLSLGILGHFIYQYLIEMNIPIAMNEKVAITLFSTSLSTLALLLYSSTFQPLKQLQMNTLKSKASQ